MTTQFRSLALLTCITAATAFGSQIAVADTSSPTKQTEVKGDHHKHKGHRGHRGHKGDRGNYHEKMAKELGLTDQQKSQAKALFQANREDSKMMFSTLRTEKRQLHSLVQSGSADESAIRAQAAKVADVQEELAVKRAQTTKQFLTMLTPGQVTKFKEIQAKREAKRESRRDGKGDFHSKGFERCDDSQMK
jgi:protein CpxP